ncbi:ribosome assembly RNA-binding protein YhbY [bacterium]|nr:ribosome assembly RNA-binding protein YhbY [bacterium]
MSELQGFQRRYLRSKAHHLEPVVMIGKNGMTAQVVDKAIEALTAHELIKVRFVEFKDQKKVMAPELAKATESELAGILGHVAILYKPHSEPEKREIRLPERKK